MPGRGPSAALVARALVFTLLVPGGLVLGWLPWWLTRATLHDELGPWRHAGWVLLALGLLGYLRCEFEFVWKGGGTPFPLDAPKRFVASGLYRHVRNPMYVSLGLALLGEALLYEARVLLLLLLGFWAATHAFVVLYEEPHLRRIFGASYEAYLQAVPRWWPRRGAWEPPADSPSKTA